MAVGCDNRSPKLMSVTPTTLCANNDMDLTLLGSDLDASKVEIGLSPDGGTPSGLVPAASITGSGDMQVARFTAGTLTPSATNYDVIYTDKNGTVIVLPGAVKVVEGVTVFYVDPPYVYGNISTPITIYTTGIAGPLPTTGAVTLTPQGGGAPVDLSATARIDTNHPKHVIADVPPGTPAGVYDLTLKDVNGCTATYKSAVTVVTASTTLKDISPPFGYDQATTAVTIDATADFFKGGARAYLTKHGAANSPAVALQAPVAQSGTVLTAIVPNLGEQCTAAGQPVTCDDGLWDVVVVNPDGTIGFLDNGGAGAFTVEPQPVPVITSISPAGVVSTATTDVTINGANFAVAAGSTPAPVVLSCQLVGTTTPTTITPALSGTPTATSIKFTVTSGLITAPSICIVTVNNSVGNSTFATGAVLAVFSNSFNIETVTQGTPLTTPRRSPAVTVNGPTTAARYVYAIGGDNGALDATSKLPTAPIDTVEYALTDPFTGVKAWSQLPDQAKLPKPVTHAGVVSSGRFIYLVGGYSGDSQKTVLRAQVLDPAEAPQIDDADLVPDANDGLTPGLYFYRVAAVLKADDPVNPGGETLAGDEFAINVPTYKTDKFQVTISWKGGPASNIDHWRIYRTSAAGAAPGSEDVVFSTTDASATMLVDKGPTMTPFVNGTPQPFGAIGKWATEPSLNVARAGASVALVQDPTVPTRAYLYAGHGYDSGGAQFPTTYEFLVIDPTTSTPPAGPWSTPADITNGATADAGRWLGGAYGVTSDIDSAACPATGACQAYVFFGAGAGTTAGDAITGAPVGNVTDIATVAQGATGGALTFLAVTGSSAPANGNYGYGAVTATNFLFAIGGGSNGNATPKLNANKITAATSPTLQPGMASAWNPNGQGALPAGRFEPGVAFGVPYFYTVGGTDVAGGTAKTDTFYDLF